MDELISIIVPIYNVEPYLVKCIDSILKQTYRNIEIILVDDGSTDGSSKICDDYERREDRIKVIHQKNGGLTVTRRAGVNLANGKYIGFVDGDDWVEPNMYQVLHDYICNEKVDIVTSRGYREYYWGTGEVTLGDTIPSGKYEINEEKHYILTHLFSGIPGKDEYINGAVWNKIFRTEIIKSVLNKIDERVHGYMDDTVCVIGCIIESKNIMITQDVLYHHRERADSFTYSKNPRGLLQVNYGYLALKQIVEQSIYKDKIFSDLLESVAHSAISAFNNLFETDEYTVPNYFFRSQKITIGSRVLIYGAGNVGKAYWRQLNAEKKYQLLGIIDRRASAFFDQKNIFGLEHIKDFKYDYIIIAIKSAELYTQIRNQLIQENIPGEKIVWEAPLSIFDFFN